jgi:DNA-binding response OmpR family regulator
MPASRLPLILVVEDEPALGRLLIRALEWDGYDVVWVNGEAGLRAAKIWGKPFDLVITNSQRPGVAGVDLIGQVNALFPRLPVLRLDDLSLPSGQTRGDPILFKPFGLDSLSEAVRTLLGTPVTQH